MAHPARTQHPDDAVEARARAALEERKGRRLSDQEWEAAKHDLLTVFRLLKTGNESIAPNTEDRPKRRLLSLAIHEGSG